MLKLTVGMLALVLAGTAGAAGWRSLRIDASSEDSFNESVTALQDELPRVRRHVLDQSLKDIWAQGTKAAEADGRVYTASDYHRQVDGLGYEQVVTFTDPTGDTARRYRANYQRNLRLSQLPVDALSKSPFPTVVDPGRPPPGPPVPPNPNRY